MAAVAKKAVGIRATAVLPDTEWSLLNCSGLISMLPTYPNGVTR